MNFHGWTQTSPGWKSCLFIARLQIPRKHQGMFYKCCFSKNTLKINTFFSVILIVSHHTRQNSTLVLAHTIYRESTTLLHTVSFLETLRKLTYVLRCVCVCCCKDEKSSYISSRKNILILMIYWTHQNEVQLNYMKYS